MNNGTTMANIKQVLNSEYLILDPYSINFDKISLKFSER